MSLSYREVAEIMKIIDASSMEEVILEVDGARLVVRRGAGGSGASVAPPAGDSPAGEQPAPAPARVSASASASTARADKATSGDTGGSEFVRAPMVGTFYRSPSPGEPPFVEEGSRVEAGDPLCLIEVMKLYTTIEASASGAITRILAEDAALVEFDQPLFEIGP